MFHTHCRNYTLVGCFFVFALYCGKYTLVIVGALTSKNMVVWFWGVCKTLVVWFWGVCKTLAVWFWGVCKTLVVWF